MKNIVYINVNEIYEHPDNPRKDLGDLSELADSIRENGIFQNLTVVPLKSKIKPDLKLNGYTVIIGHRRLAAAKLAGLDVVPQDDFMREVAEGLEKLYEENNRQKAEIERLKELLEGWKAEAYKVADEKDKLYCEADERLKAIKAKYMEGDEE